MEKVELELWNRTRYRFRNVAFYRKESVWGKNAWERNIYWGIYRWEKRNEKVALENGIVFPAYKRCFCTVRSNEYGPIGRKILEKDRGKASLPRGTRRNIAGKTNKGSRKLKRLWNRIGILSSKSSFPWDFFPTRWISKARSMFHRAYYLYYAWCTRGTSSFSSLILEVSFFDRRWYTIVASFTWWNIVMHCRSDREKFKFTGFIMTRTIE